MGRRDGREERRLGEGRREEGKKRVTRKVENNEGKMKNGERKK